MNRPSKRPPPIPALPPRLSESQRTGPPPLSPDTLGERRGLPPSGTPDEPPIGTTSETPPALLSTAWDGMGERHRTAPPPTGEDEDRLRTTPPMTGEAGDHPRTTPPSSRTEPPAGRPRTQRPGATDSFVFGMVRAVLLRHLGPTTVEGMLTTACRYGGISPETMSVQELKLLVEELLPVIRTLCDADRRPQLLAELDELHHLRG
jgi:hypothetical protein